MQMHGVSGHVLLKARSVLGAAALRQVSTDPLEVSRHEGPDGDAAPGADVRR
jgi:hypothetical protein